ncbi:unnamed protein product [Fraxinus pennsylvanica]|uniref:non-specific serine/threonine protein kinase n=1 Tax=Fraxinus pennsylvanica TaxID=56036 RepID=A0AAD2DSA7_9LAMI|nr:unnamed protein product [Fraxinus pennsylvanica]
MPFKIALLVLYFLVGQATMEDVKFKFNGFQSADLSLNGIAGITSSGLLKLTNATKQGVGQAFYPSPINFKNSNGSAFSFSTSFVFAIEPQYPDLSGHGIAFVLAPTRGLPGARASRYLGLFNERNDGNSSNHVFAVELDTIQDNEFLDINPNHVGIDINSMKSVKSEPAGYYANGNGVLRNLTLYSGKPMQVWVEYDGLAKKISVTLAPLYANKPNTSLLSLLYDLSPILKQTMYVGFSSSTGSAQTSHYVLGWSFKVNGISEGLDPSRLPKVPRIGPKEKSKFLTIGLPTISLVLLLTAISGMAYYMRRKKKYAEELEDWELEYGPHRFKLYDHGTDPQTTHVVGTLGYLAPEHSRTGRATTSTDVYAFGAFLLEVACGRRPIEQLAPTEDIILVDWVFSHWTRGEILQAVDSKLGNEYVKEEVELVLKLGLICSNSDAVARPNMQQILLCLERTVALPELSSLRISRAGITFAHGEGFDEFIMSRPSSASKAFTYSSSVADSLLSGGR